MKINEKGLQIIKDSETLKLERYICPGGYPTIGWGHRIRPGEQYTIITEAQAEELLRNDIAQAERAVSDLVTVPLTENQFSALVSFVFNVGSDIDTDAIPEGLGDSKLLKYLNAGMYLKAANEFPKWKRSNGKVLNGLIVRRAKERSLFLET